MKKRTAKTKSSQPKLAEYTINLETIEASVAEAKATLDALYLLLNAVIEQLAAAQGRAKK
jgi:small-conductance mechanosensitive channel